MTTQISNTAWRYFYGAWLAYLLIIGFVNTTNVIMEQARHMQPIIWRAFVNEYSGVLALFLLIPVVRRFNAYFPFQSNQWKLPLLAHFLFTIPFSVVHSLLFISARKVLYPSFDADYQFGEIAYEWLYEYRKITMGYISVILSLYAFRHYVHLRHLLNLPEAHGEAAQTAGTTYLRRIITNANDRDIIVDTKEILFLEASGNYVVVHTNNRQYRLRSTLAKLEERLDPDDFVRIHRSYIVNVSAIKEIQPWFRGDQRVMLSNGEMINLSRRYRDQFSASVDRLRI